MRILFMGDVIGSLGRKALATYVPKLKKKYRPQMTIVNGENAASGRETAGKIYEKFLQDGVDTAAVDNRMWDNKDISEFIDDAKKVARPVNFSEDMPDQGIVFVKVNQLEPAVINLQARIFMMLLEDPFKKAVELVAIARRRTPLIFVDFYGRTTSERQAMSWFLDGQVPAIVGTHTHVQADDARILPKGTASLGDVGMTGPYDGILGIKREPIIEKLVTVLPKRSEVVKTGRTILSAYTLEIDNQTGQAKTIESIQISGNRPLQEQQKEN